MNNYLDYIIDITKQILAIDSPSGYTKKAIDFISQQYRALGYEPEQTAKGGLLISLGGRTNCYGRLLTDHTDTFGFCQ